MAARQESTFLETILYDSESVKWFLNELKIADTESNREIVESSIISVLDGNFGDARGKIDALIFEHVESINGG